jgi:hypothetical protein
MMRTCVSATHLARKVVRPTMAHHCTGKAVVTRSWPRLAMAISEMVPPSAPQKRTVFCAVGGDWMGSRRVAPLAPDDERQVTP